jgi:hypothetical protein
MDDSSSWSASVSSYHQQDVETPAETTSDMVTIDARVEPIGGKEASPDDSFATISIMIHAALAMIMIALVAT